MQPPPIPFVIRYSEFAHEAEIAADNLIEFFQYSGEQETNELLRPWGEGRDGLRRTGIKMFQAAAPALILAMVLPARTADERAIKPRGAGLPGDCRRHEDRWRGKD